MNSKAYIPGVCNIGPVEIAARKRAGWIGIFVTALLWAILFYFGAPSPWRLLVFFPAAMAATGFI